MEGNVQLSDTFSQLLFLPTSGGRLGRVEICVNGRRAGVSGDSWDNEDASVLCRQLGFSPYGEYYKHHNSLVVSLATFFQYHYYFDSSSVK